MCACPRHYVIICSRKSRFCHCSDLKNAEIPAQQAVDKEEYKRIMAELENNREDEGDSEDARMNSKYLSLTPSVESCLT